MAQELGTPPVNPAGAGRDPADMRQQALAQLNSMIQKSTGKPRFAAPNGEQAIRDDAATLPPDGAPSARARADRSGCAEAAAPAGLAVSTKKTADTRAPTRSRLSVPLPMGLRLRRGLESFPGSLELSKPREPLSGSPATIAELLGTPQSARAIATLQTMGSSAEDAVIPHLRSDNWFARKDACQVLKVIGTEKSVSELRVIAENNGLSARDAREALLEIARRSGSPDPPAAEPRGAPCADP